MQSKTQRIILGIIILILVDVIWVTSGELTKYLYKDEEYIKPFFCTYFKTSMFTVYLIVIGLIAPWRELCEQNMAPPVANHSPEEEGYYSTQESLSKPTFVPIRKSGAISSTESDDSSIRSVRFNKMAEVREMSAHEATEALLSRLSYSASLRIRRRKVHHKTAKTALLFCILWFIANYLYQLSLEVSESALVMLLSSSSSFFVLVLAGVFPSSFGDRFTFSKLLAVIMNIGGVLTVTISSLSDSDLSRNLMLALLSAIFYAAYLVFVKRKNDIEEKIDIPLFFGFVGLWNLVLMWPILFVLNFLQIETFELPNQNQLAILFLNAIMGTVVSEALWLWGCFLTSSLIATLAMSLQIPMSIIFDITLDRKSNSSLLYVGLVIIFLTLLIVAFLAANDDFDPTFQFARAIYRKLCRCRRGTIVRVNDDEQQESLIGNQD